MLDGIARALHLDEVERAHLLDLVWMANASPVVHRRPARQQVRPSVRRLLDSMTDTAAFLRNGRLDILAANPLGHALYSPVFDSLASGDPRRPANLARFIFLDDQSPRFYRDWDGIAHAAVGSLRAEAGRAPHDRALTSLVGELSLRSQPFRELWAAHDVEYYRSGIEPFRHPLARRPRPRVRRPGDPARPGADHHRLQRRTGFGRPPGTWHPRQLGRYPTTSGTAQYGRAPGRAHTWVAPNTVARIRCRRGQQRCRGLRLGRGR